MNATVTAVNLIGDSDVSNVGNGAIIATAPGTPTNLAKDNAHITYDQVSFTWSAPKDDGGIPLLDYLVEKYDEAAGNFVEVANVTETSYTLSDLPENKTFKFRVRAENNIGYGEYSSELTIATLMGTNSFLHAFSKNQHALSVFGLLLGQMPMRR